MTDVPPRPVRPLSGLLFAGATAVVSGVSVFVNSYGVHHVSQPAVYTTGKNLVAALVLGAVVLAAGTRAAPGAAAPSRAPAGGRRGRVLGLAYVGVVGGGLAFVLFFTGLAQSSAEPAAFLHDTLVFWVALLALPLLGERVSPWNVAAVVLLVAGQALTTGGIGHLVAGRGALLVLAATVLWALETVIAKRLLRGFVPLRLGALRMGAGALVLVGYLAVTGHLGALVALDGDQLGWMLLTGGLLAAYVAFWMVALSRARAVDVTSVLVASVVVTSLLGALAGHGEPAPEGLGLVLVGVGLAATLVARPRRVAL
jgi:drug/metabolite transporter (DMT)-like permease